MTLADRLRRERVAKGLSQRAFAIAGGVKVVAQRNYESGMRSPRADYLCALEALGIDVCYILTGVHSPSSETQLSEAEITVIRRLRSLSAVDRESVQRIIGTMVGGVE